MLRRYYEKTIICIIVLVLMLFISCTSTNPGTRQNVLDHQKQLAELEARNKDLESRLARYDSVVGTSIRRLKTIRERTEHSENTIDRTIEVFEQYQRTVEQLIRDYNNIKSSNEDKNEDNNNTSSGTSN